MPKDGRKTRTRILAEAKQLVLENGFAGTSIDQILERTGLTKGTFFYHFQNKADLALQLIEYFVQADMEELEASLEETASLASQPRSRLLAYVQRFIDIFEVLEAPPPGCLYASYVNELEQFSTEVHQRMEEALLRWRAAIGQLLEETARAHPPRHPVNADSLADLFTVITEGAYIISKALNAPKLTAEQLRHYRQYLELVFPE